MTDAKHVIVIGAGHNGLACAAYLAKAGRRVTVLEAAGQVGGAAVTREFAPGFRVSACAHFSYLLDARIAKELELARHGLATARADLRTVSLQPADEHLVLNGGTVEAGRVNEADRAALAAHHAAMLKFARVLGRQHHRIPPRLLGGGRSNAIGAALLAWDIRRLGRDDMREFLRVAGINIFDIVEESFESPALKAALAFDAVLGTNLSPRANNSMLALLHRLSGQASGTAGGVSLPAGGMGAVSEAFAKAATAAGATLRLSAPVKQIALNGDRVAGVVLESGETLAADVVVSNADPKRTLLELLGARHLETGFVHRIRHFRTKGMAAKLHLALDSLPGFPRLPAALAGERLVIAPDLVYLEHAFDAAKYGETSPQPALEISIPTVHDRTLAPAGKHVLSAVVQYAPYVAEASTDAARAQLLENTLNVLESYAPGIRGKVLASQLLLPADLEREFRLTGGHWHHGELALDQMLMLRPVPGAAQYAMPVDGLYLCGAGTHPGGGVMGCAGRNAAQAVLRAERA
ncbi:MAG TPA: NAD(P)/FAD-dependent oxidoreductase [Steroidobacteraceae bacterium]|nr:NAD(P)/FAD-dependent oxidoreductase [Steroidobacteraceae bacterium]